MHTNRIALEKQQLKEKLAESEALIKTIKREHEVIIRKKQESAASVVSST